MMARVKYCFFSQFKFRPGIQVFIYGFRPGIKLFKSRFIWILGLKQTWNWGAEFQVYFNKSNVLPFHPGLFKSIELYFCVLISQEVWKTKKKSLICKSVVNINNSEEENWVPHCKTLTQLTPSDSKTEKDSC